MRRFTRVVRVSGTEFNRKGRSRFFKDLKSGAIGKVIVTRHGKDTYEMALLPRAKELLKSGWEPSNLGDCFIARQDARKN